MKVIVKYDHWLPQLVGAYAITLYPFVLFTESIDECIESNVIEHEVAHVRQIRNLGWFKFYWSYFGQYLRARFTGKTDTEAYEGISFEIEAFRDESLIELTAPELAEFGIDYELEDK